MGKRLRAKNRRAWRENRMRMRVYGDRAWLSLCERAAGGSMRAERLLSEAGHEMHWRSRRRSRVVKTKWVKRTGKVNLTTVRPAGKRISKERVPAQEIMARIDEIAGMLP